MSTDAELDYATLSSMALNHPDQLLAITVDVTRGLGAMRAHAHELHELLVRTDALLGRTTMAMEFAITDRVELARLVKWEHDRQHTDAWPACRHEVCTKARTMPRFA